MVHESFKLDRLHTQFAVGCWLGGAAAGLARSLVLEDAVSMLPGALLGLLFTQLSAALGVFLGMFGRYFMLKFNKGDVAQVDRTDPVGCLVLGGFLGAWLGLLFALMFLHWGSAVISASVGAFCFAFAGMLAGDMVPILFRMISLEGEAGRTDIPDKEREQDEDDPFLQKRAREKKKAKKPPKDEIALR